MAGEPKNPFGTVRAASGPSETASGPSETADEAPSGPVNPSRDPDPGPDDTDVDPKVAAVLTKERRAAREAVRRADAAELKLRELDDAKKSDVDRANERATRAEERLAQVESRALRAEVAAAKGLPPNLAARLQGSTQEELEADADELLSVVGTPKTTTRRDPDQGRRDTPARGEADMNSWMRSATGTRT